MAGDPQKKGSVRDGIWQNFVASATSAKPNQPMRRTPFPSKHLFLLVFICLLSSKSGFSQSDGQDRQKPRFSKRDVRNAQKITGMAFTKQEIDTMYSYLQRNLAGYDSMRMFDLPIDVGPALYFDPRPRDFVFQQELPTPIMWPAIDADFTRPENEEEIAFLSVAELAHLVKTRQITSVELTRFFLERLERFDPILKATITITSDLALRRASKADREIKEGLYRGPLHGIPYGLKDLAAVPGYRTTWGAGPYRDQVLDQKATIFEKLDSSGAILIAKLTSGALARGDVWFGGRTVNPWDTLQGASGSSAGSGAATAAGLVPFSIGTETLGSIISPSSRCGVTGLRPTFGRVSRYGIMSLSWSMDKVGPICRNALDCALVFDAIRGADARDRSSVDAAFNFRVGQNPADLRVGYLKSFIDKDTSSQGDNAREAMLVFRQMGIKPDSIELPQALPFEVFDIILRSEAGAFFDELVRTNLDDNMVQQSQRSRANSLRQARFIPAVEYLQANRHRALLIEAMHRLMQKYDVIISPPRAGNQSLITNLTGHPAISVPSGFDAKGRPTSITLIGNLYDEASILSLAHDFQKLTRHHKTFPPLFKTPMIGE